MAKVCWLSRRLVGVGLSLALVACGGRATADVLYSQPTGGPHGWYVPSDDFDRDRAYDDFILDEDADVQAASWIGAKGSDDFWKPSEFTISFCRDSGIGTPVVQPLLYKETIHGTANETLVSTDRFRYEVQFPRPFKALAHKRYWFSVVGDSPARQTWYWIDGQGPNSRSYLVRHNVPDLVPTDLCFTLYGARASTIPEPGTGSLLLICATALPLLRRRVQPSTLHSWPSEHGVSRSTNPPAAVRRAVRVSAADTSRFPMSRRVGSSGSSGSSDQISAV